MAKSSGHAGSILALDTLSPGAYPGFFQGVFRFGTELQMQGCEGKKPQLLTNFEYQKSYNRSYRVDA